MGEMADLMLFSHYDIDNFDDDALSGYCRRRYRYNTRPYDPAYYSRREAVCERCNTRYDKLRHSVTETAKNARKDGWQIEFNGEWYEWYCPKCKAAHDFEGIANEKGGNSDG